MELESQFSVPNAEVWFVQAVLTECEGLAVVSLGRRGPRRSMITVLYDNSAAEELFPLVAYLERTGKIAAVEGNEPGMGD